MSHLKVLVCGINAYSFQLHGFIFMLCYTHLNLAFLLHKTVLVTFLLGSTVSTTKYYVSNALSTLQLIYAFCFSNSCDFFPSVSYTSDYNSSTKNYNHYRNPNLLFPFPRGLSNLYYNYNRLSNLFIQIFSSRKQSLKVI